MESNYQIKPIGVIHVKNDEYSIQVDKPFVPALTNIEGFSHLQIVWWGNLYDTPEYRGILNINKPYKRGPENIGVFATRSPLRPNPILITTVAVLSIDHENGIINTPYIDAEDGTPILDIKPYHLMERIKECKVPQWCQHWPLWYEDSAVFNWQDEFNF